ncbi:hypothetical protein HDV00_000267 [Rhizophlyctis rosea]|nr:hypothetical protein HDV00_000267 [Rhizophlyctis rosea]
MPTIEIQTNVAIPDVNKQVECKLYGSRTSTLLGANPGTTVFKTLPEQQEIVKQISATAASALGKPESYVCVVLNDKVTMSFGGSFDPAAFVRVGSIGAIGKSENKV